MYKYIHWDRIAAQNFNIPTGVDFKATAESILIGDKNTLVRAQVEAIQSFSH